jgi:hypothetical protein
MRGKLDSKVAPACASGNLPVPKPLLDITIHGHIIDSQICYLLCSRSYQDRLEVFLASVFVFNEMLPPFDYFEYRRA